ncbi:unnamed protein product, partial [Porites lobata]
MKLCQQSYSETMRCKLMRYLKADDPVSEMAAEMNSISPRNTFAPWPFRKPRSELRLGFFEANTCKLTYSSAYDGVSEKCQKKHLQGVQEAFACLSTVPAKTNHASTTHLS